MTRPDGGKRTWVVFLFCAATVIALPAQTLNTLYNFCSQGGFPTCTDGSFPHAGLVQATDGDFYGATFWGGAGGCTGFGCGTIFKISAVGTLITLHSFDSTDGEYPSAALVQVTNGDFYGTTSAGGTKSAEDGTVFTTTAAGKLTTLYSFDGTDGYSPNALVQATDGNFYGTTSYGGAGQSCTYGCGTVFTITPGGNLTTLYSFGGTDGSYPNALVQATDGNFYGTTASGGINTNCYGYYGCGTVFKITPAGTLTTLYSFCSQTSCADGYSPNALVQATDGNFYGTTNSGGAKCGFKCGTVFTITPGGNLTTLYSFGGTDGSYPNALVQATDGNFYGTTSDGGVGQSCTLGCGTVFAITPGGNLTTLHSFDYTDGCNPNALVQATNGNFYGTTYDCGPMINAGTVFSLSVGLGAFVETNPTSGKVGAKVIILGNNLKGTTSVTFNGTPASFKTYSTYITTTVPAGATTGPVQVTTPKPTPSNGTLTSNVPFVILVAPQIKNFTPPSGPAGTPVQITGVNLTNTDVVTFGGVVAPDFTVNSDTQVTATVPTGAKTGKIKITTPGGTAKSAGSFNVTE